MKKVIFFICFLFISSLCFAQRYDLIFNQRGTIFEGHTVDNNYYLNGCSFDARYTQTPSYLKIEVFNPSMAGYVPATFYLYGNGSLTVYANNEQYSGAWRVTPGGPTFKNKDLPASATIKKKPGTANTFIITLGKFQVEVRGGTKTVTIDHIKYNLPELHD